MMNYDDKIMEILTIKQRINLIRTTLETLVSENELFENVNELLNICNKLSLKKEKLTNELNDLVKELENNI